VHKPKLALVLPIVQFAIAAPLLYLAGANRSPVPTTRLVCSGLNAPAVLFAKLIAAAGVALKWLPGLVYLPGLDYDVEISDIFILVGVILVWFLVGRSIDRQRGPNPEVKSRTATALLWYTFLFATGGLLFFVGLLDFQQPNFDNLSHRLYRGILTLLWAVSLIFIASKGLTRTIRSRNTGSG
jgi:hypothetical protein